MSRFIPAVVAALLLTVPASPSWGQGSAATSFSRSSTSTGSTGSTGSSNRFGSSPTSRTQGLSQTGQLTSEAAIARGTDTFVGGSGFGNFLSNSGSTTGRTGTTGGLGGMSGMSGTSGLGSFGLGLGVGGNRGMNNMSGGGMNSNRGMMGNTRNTQGTSGTTQIRTQIALGFTVPKPAASEVSARLTNRLPRIPGLESVSGLDVKMDGQIAVLQGVVATERERDLIARLALLEPGISDVRNELTVSPSSAEPRPLQ